MTRSKKHIIHLAAFKMIQKRSTKKAHVSNIMKTISYNRKKFLFTLGVSINFIIERNKERIIWLSEREENGLNQCGITAILLNTKTDGGKTFT